MLTTLRRGLRADIVTPDSVAVCKGQRYMSENSEIRVPSIADFSPEQLQAVQLFFPYAFEKTMAALQSQIRFVHYSSAEAAMKMLSNGEVWMRRASAMNDFREIDYGKDLLISAYRAETGQKFKSFLEGIFPGVSGEVENLFDGWYPHFVNSTYLTCISEHLESEDGIGRLSMWRAYGGATGVAVVIKGTPFITPTDALRAYTSPVAYLSSKQFEREFERLCTGLMSHADLLTKWGRTFVLNNLFDAFRAATVCTKHPGFHEEREWRVVYNPAFKKSERITSSVELIRGVPQIVQKIPLKDIPEEGLLGVTVPDLIDRVIVGPTNFPFEMREAIIDVLEAKGVADAASKVIVSDIPLRQG